METQNKLTAFCQAYLACALWSSNDESTPAGGEPFDANYSIPDIAPEAIQKAVAECAQFQAENAADIAAAELTDGRAGHCFWLNRNHHGSGFWDEYSRDGSPQYDACQRLSDASHEFKECDMYLGDDGLIYLS